MATDKSLTELMSRLDRIEAVLASRIPQVFDPPPDDFGRFGGVAAGSGRSPFRGPIPATPCRSTSRA